MFQLHTGSGLIHYREVDTYVSNIGKLSVSSKFTECSLITNKFPFWLVFVNNQ